MLQNACKHTPPWETLQRNRVVLYLEIQLYAGAQAGKVLPIQKIAFAIIYVDITCVCLCSRECQSS